MTHTLMISTEMPVSPMTGGRIRTRELARALSTLGRVTIAAFVLEDEQPPVLPEPVRAVAVPWESPLLYEQMRSDDQTASARAFEVLAHQIPEPWIVSSYESEQFRGAVRALARADVDLVVIEHTLMGAYMAEVPADVPTVLDLHNVHSRAARRAVQRGHEDPREARRVALFERSLIKDATMTLVVSDVEALAARELAPGARVEVVPNGVDTSFFTPSAGQPVPGYLLFTGLMNYVPNVEAVKWFVEEILPELPDATLHVVGSTPADEVQDLASSQVLIHGEVSDTRRYQSEACVVVAPVLSGGGTRLKVLEAAACGNAVVSTSLGAEGLDLVDGRDLLIADSAEDFADAVGRVLRDEHLRAYLGRNARSAAGRYEWQEIGQRLGELAAPLIGERAAVLPST